MTSDPGRVKPSADRDAVSSFVSSIQIRADGTTWMVGPVRSGVNLSADATEGIHNDEVATAIGFRGGTVAGDIHFDQFGPVLLETFGQQWFRTGSLSLYFKHATLDGEPVIASIEQPRFDAGDSNHDHNQQGRAVTVAAEMRTPEGIVVAEGTASLGTGEHENSALRSRDLRALDPSGLRILKGVQIGQQFVPIELAPRGEEQRSRIQRGLITEPLSWYSEDSPWGAAIASPLTVANLLSWEIAQPLAASLPQNVGMFGALEIAFVNGPIRLDERYVISGKIIAVSDSPKTEILWYETEAHSVNGELIATCRMMTRFVKASSPLYASPL